MAKLLRVRDGHAGHDEGRAAPRRLRLHDRLSGGADDARDAKIGEIGEGTSEIQRIVIAR